MFSRGAGSSRGERRLLAASGDFSRRAETSRGERGFPAWSGDLRRRAECSRGEREGLAGSGAFPLSAGTFRGKRRLSARSGVFPRDARTFRETRGPAAGREHPPQPATSRPAYHRVKIDVGNRSFQFGETFLAPGTFFTFSSRPFLFASSPSTQAAPPVDLLPEPGQYRGQRYVKHRSWSGEWLVIWPRRFRCFRLNPTSPTSQFASATAVTCRVIRSLVLTCTAPRLPR